jgi:hypothetical protein
MKSDTTTFKAMPLAGSVSVPMVDGQIAVIRQVDVYRSGLADGLMVGLVVCLIVLLAWRIFA